MKEIILCSGQVCLVDDDLYICLSKFPWHLAGDYAATDLEKKIYMHQMVMSLNNITVPTNLLIDHKNQNKLDNQYSNLRVADRQTNALNSKLNVLNTSGCKGVYWCRKRNKWYAQIHLHGTSIDLGSYFKFEDAVCARQRAEQRYIRKD